MRSEVLRTVNVTVLQDGIRRRDPLGKEKVGIEAGISASYLEKIMNRTRVPSAEAMNQIAKALNVDLEVLFPLKKRAKQLA